MPSDPAIEECLRLLDEVWPPEGAPGDVVPRELGRFRILAELGRGGFGVVFLAEDPGLGRRVALKVPRVEVLTDSEAWRRFLREVRAAAGLYHPNIVPLLEAGAVGPVGFIVSAYVPGPSLEQWLRSRCGPVPPRWAAALLAALARAIDYVHGRNILHRDLKPANVLLDAPGSSVDPAVPATWQAVPIGSWIPRICDFGLAKLFEIEGEETHSRVICGSPPYMAPEQAESRREEIGPATDVYGLGAILYELLTGRPPFGGRSNLETLRRVVSEEPVPPRSRRPGIPIDLETIVLKCLAKRPDRRYATAAALADDLERYLDGRPIAARPTPAWERGARWTRRHPAAAILASAVVLAVVGGLSGLLWHGAVLREKNGELQREALRAERHAREADAQRTLADQQARLLRRQLAGSQLFQAQQAIASGNYERARRLLEITGTSFGAAGNPCFSWRYLGGCVADRLEVLSGHEGTVEGLTPSPDGRSLASGDDRGEIRIWDLAEGRCRLSIVGAHRAVGRLAWSPDGTALASSDRDSGAIRLWDAATGRSRGDLPQAGAGEPVWVLSFSADGSRIAAARPRRDRQAAPVTRWDITRPDGALIAPAEAGSRPGVGDRVRLIAGLLDPGGTSGTPIPSISDGGAGDADPPAVAFTGDHGLAVVALGGESFGVFRDRTRFQVALIRIRPGGSVVVLFEQFRREDASPPAERERLRRLATRLIPGGPKGPPPPAILLRAEGSAASTVVPSTGELIVWDEAHDRLFSFDPATRRERTISELGPLSGVRGLCYEPGRDLLAVGSEDHRLRLRHARPGHRTISTRGHSPKEAWSVAFSRDGRTLASGGDDGLIRLWEVGTGRQTAVLRRHHSLVTSVAFSPDGRTLASGSFDERNLVLLWDLESGRPVRSFEGHRSPVRCVDFSPDGRALASSGDDASLMLWDPRDGHRTAAIDLGRSPGPRYLAFSPDGRTIAACGGHRIDLVDVATGRFQSLPVEDEVSPLRFSRDGSLLVAGLRDGSIRIWDLADRREIRKVQGHAGRVIGLALSPDGLELASAGEDGTVRLWDLATGQEWLCLTDCRARVNSVAFSPDGRVLAAADHSGAVTTWDARPGR